MENNQSIRDVINSILKDVNANTQIESTLNLVETLNEQIIVLKNDIVKLNPQIKKRKIPSWLWILLTSIVGAIIFIGAMILFQRCFGFEASYENGTTIVLGFVGIAATFIVVSNYAQVREIERKFENKVNEIEGNVNNTINERLQEFSKVETRITDAEKNVKDLEQKHKRLYSELLYRIHETKGIAYENVDAKKSITHYLLAIENMFNENNRIDATVILGEVNALWEGRDAVKQIFKNDSISDTIHRIKRHPNYAAIPEFEYFLMKIDYE
jgi:hypothetical protein